MILRKDFTDYARMAACMNWLRIKVVRVQQLHDGTERPKYQNLQPGSSKQTCCMESGVSEDVTAKNNCAKSKCKKAFSYRVNSPVE